MSFGDFRSTVFAELCFFCNLLCWNICYDEYSLLLWWFLCSFLMAFACDLSSVLFWAPPFLNMGHTQRGTTSQIVNTHLVLELASTTPASTKAQMLMEDINRAVKHLRRLCLGFDKLRWISPHLSNQLPCWVDYDQWLCYFICICSICMYIDACIFSLVARRELRSYGYPGSY